MGDYIRGVLWGLVRGIPGVLDHSSGDLRWHVILAAGLCYGLGQALSCHYDTLLQTLDMGVSKN